jgi:hypothetical protein
VNESLDFLIARQEGVLIERFTLPVPLHDVFHFFAGIGFAECAQRLSDKAAKIQYNSVFFSY